jgi:hypothetical protein
MALFERRNLEAKRSSPLPSDYLAMVTEVFATNFDDGIKKLTKLTKEKVHFDASGAIYPEEIILCVTLLQEKKLNASTVYASVDFDPKASSPTIQELLPLCVDAIGAVFQPLLTSKDPEIYDQLVSSSLSALDNIPFEWTKLQVENKRVYVKMNKANPLLENMADDWLKKHDPKLKDMEEEEEEQVKSLFITGPKKGSGNLH